MSMQMQMPKNPISLPSSSSFSSNANAVGSVVGSAKTKIKDFLGPKKIDYTIIQYWNSLPEQFTKIGVKSQAVEAPPLDPNNKADLFLDNTGVAHNKPVMNPIKVATLMLPGPGGILLARPVKELVAHIFDHKLPSFQLIARVIKVLVLGIFRWHLCDHVILHTYHGHVHSLNGKVTTSNLELTNPYCFENSIWLKLNDGLLNKYDPSGKHPTHDCKYEGDTFIRCPEFKGYKEINAQTTREYYNNFFGVDITTKMTGNTTYDLLKSKALTIVKS